MSRCFFMTEESADYTDYADKNRQMATKRHKKHKKCSSHLAGTAGSPLPSSVFLLRLLCLGGHLLTVTHRNHQLALDDGNGFEFLFALVALGDLFRRQPGALLGRDWLVLFRKGKGKDGNNQNHRQQDLLSHSGVLRKRILRGQITQNREN